MAAPRLLLVGCGKMGGALLDGWLARGLPAASVTVIEPLAATAEAARARYGVSAVESVEAVAADFAPNVVLFAVKPQMMDAAAAPCARFAAPQTLFLSIAAGKTIAYFREQLGKTAVIVRAMPNTPAAVGRGMTVCCAGAGVTADQRCLAQELMEAVGAVEWVEEEALLDPVTAVSGGGPAYVALLVEALARAGADSGLPEDLAMRIATDAVQLHGGYGYIKDYRVERLMRDAKICQIWEGTKQVHQQYIGRSFIDR